MGQQTSTVQRRDTQPPALVNSKPAIIDAKRTIEDNKSSSTTTTNTEGADVTGTKAKDYSVYTDPVTNRIHQYAPNENVILVGPAASFVKSMNYASLGRIQSLDKQNGTVELQLFTPGEPSEEGGIGIPSVTKVYKISESIRPLPFQFSAVDQKILVQNSSIFTCERTSSVNPAGCASCDPQGQLFGAETYADRLNQVFNMVTDVKGGPGSTRYTLFACPATILRAGQPVSVANSMCKSVIVATITGSTNTNRYSIISQMEPIAFRAAFLYAYGLPVDDIAYYRAVRWSTIPEYQQLQSQLQGERITCLNVDAGWLDQHIRELLAKGYEAKEITLLPGETPGARTKRLLSTSQQQGFTALAQNGF